MGCPFVLVLVLVLDSAVTRTKRSIIFRGWNQRVIGRPNFPFYKRIRLQY